MTQEKSNRETGNTDPQGEGNYDAARRYNKATREHVRQSDVEREAHDAEPRSKDEETELERAETEGRSHAKDEDPLLGEPGAIERKP